MWGKLNKHKVFLILALSLVFILIYSPHFSYKYPYHIDEWRHINEVENIKDGHFIESFKSFEFGFHFFLVFLSFFSNLILIYQFLPAIFGVLSALALYFFAKSVTKSKNIALLSILFFASIKSNVNVMGLWFFTPLTFCIPLIFLFLMFFREGILENDQKKFIYSILIYLIIMVAHPPSASFMIPIIAIYSIINYKFFLSNKKILIFGLSVPILAAIIFTIAQRNVFDILHWLVFRKGWGVLELPLKLSYGYSLIGGILAVLGLIICYKKKNYVLMLWTSITYLLLLWFAVFDVIFFAPYQRIYYYFILSLPILSAISLNLILRLFKWKYVRILILVIVFFFVFQSYYNIPKQVDLYKPISQESYDALTYLKDHEKGKVMSTTMDSVPIFAVSGHEPVATIYFYGNRDTVNNFYSGNCTVKNRILDNQNIKYVLNKYRINCGLKLIYDKGYYVYENTITK